MLSKLDKAVDPVLGYDPKAFRPVGSPYFDKGNKDNKDNKNKK